MTGLQIGRPRPRLVKGGGDESPAPNAPVLVGLEYVRPETSESLAVAGSCWER